MGKASRTRRSKKRSRRRTVKPALSASDQRAGQRRHNNGPIIAKADTSRIGFANLPGEIRSIIYAIALQPTSSRAIKVVQQAGLNCREFALGLLCTCKAVRLEASRVFYQSNDFRIDCIEEDDRGLPPPLDDSKNNDMIKAGSIFLDLRVRNLLLR